MLATPGTTQAPTLGPRRCFLMSVYKLMGPFDLQRKCFAWLISRIVFLNLRIHQDFEIPGVGQIMFYKETLLTKDHFPGWIAARALAAVSSR